MLGSSVSIDSIERMIHFCNQYSTLISNCKKYKIIKIPSIIRGRLPFGRYVNLHNALSILPIPQNQSVFDFYKVKKENKHRYDKISTLQWCLKLIEKIYGHFIIVLYLMYRKKV